MLPDVDAEDRRFLPSMSGLSWFGVLVIASLPPSLTSHAQPEPKRPAPAAWNCSLNFVEVAERALDRVGELAGRLAAALGPISSQNIEWFQWPPPLLRTAVRTASGTLLRSLQQIVERLARELGRLLERRVEIVDVGLMMLAVMDLHRLRVDVRLERVVGVGQRGKRERHVRSPVWFRCRYARGLRRRRPRARAASAMMPGSSDRKITTRITVSMCLSMPGM